MCILFYSSWDGFHFLYLWVTGFLVNSPPVVLHVLLCPVFLQLFYLLFGYLHSFMFSFCVPVPWLLEAVVFQFTDSLFDSVLPTFTSIY